MLGVLEWINLEYCQHENNRLEKMIDSSYKKMKSLMKSDTSEKYTRP